MKAENSTGCATNTENQKNENQKTDHVVNKLGVAKTKKAYVGIVRSAATILVPLRGPKIIFPKNQIPEKKIPENIFPNSHFPENYFPERIIFGRFSKRTCFTITPQVSPAAKCTQYTGFLAVTINFHLGFVYLTHKIPTVLVWRSVVWSK